MSGAWGLQTHTSNVARNETDNISESAPWEYSHHCRPAAVRCMKEGESQRATRPPDSEETRVTEVRVVACVV